MAKPRTGSTFQRKDGSWWARAIVFDSLGKRHDLQRRAKNKTDADVVLRKLLNELEDSGDTIIEGSKTTVAAYLKRWLLTAAKPRLSERTYQDYADLIKRYVPATLSGKKLSDVRPLDIQQVYGSMQARGLSARTVRYFHAVLNSAFKQAVKWGLIPRNPAALVDLPKQVRTEMQALGPDEAGRFLAAAASDRYGVLFWFAIETGTRPEEYLGLQWKDLTLELSDKGIAVIQRTLCWRRKCGGWYFGEPKTSKSRRSIPLSDALVRSLLSHKRQQAEERLKAGPKYQNLDLVFATTDEVV